MILLGVAILVALAAVFATNAFLTRTERQAAQAPQGGVQIAVASVPLDFGAEITAEKIRMVPWPASSVPEGAFGAPTELTSGKPRFALRPIQVGEPILRSRVSGLNGRATLAANLKTDTRAMTVRISDVSGVAGFALPGDVVDVLLTRSASGPDGGQQIADVLIQAVKVIAVDQIASENKSDPVVAKTATLEVTPLDAQKLALAQQVGTISLALRPIGEPVRPLIETVSLEDLRDRATVGRASDYWSPPPAASSFAAAPAGPAPVIRRRAAAAPAKPANTSTVQVYRGTAATDYQVKRHAGF